MSVSYEYRQVEVSATDRFFVQRSSTDSHVIVCDLETSRMRRSWPALGCCVGGKRANALQSNRQLDFRVLPVTE